MHTLDESSLQAKLTSQRLVLSMKILDVLLLLKVVFLQLSELCSQLIEFFLELLIGIFFFGLLNQFHALSLVLLLEVSLKLLELLIFGDQRVSQHINL